MVNDSKKVGIIIINWNSFDLTLRCLNSLNKIDYKKYEICIVDNGSSDSSVEKLRKHYPDFNYIKNSENKGFAYAVNKGLKYGLNRKWSYFLLLNNDTIVSEDFLTLLVNEINSSETVGVVGPRIFYLNHPNKIWFTGGKIDLARGPFIHDFQDKIASEISDKVSEVDYINGCCVLIKSEVIKKTGFMREDYFMYVEDIDYIYRLKKFGYICLVVPKSQIWHDVSSSSGGLLNPIKEYYKVRNLFVFIKHNIALQEYVSWLWCGYKINLVRALYYARHQKMRVAIAIAKGIIAGTNLLILK